MPPVADHAPESLRHTIATSHAPLRPATPQLLGCAVTLATPRHTPGRRFPRLLPPEVAHTGSGGGMKLLTHNLLCSNVRGLRPGGGFPLRIQASDVCVRPVPFNAAFVARLVPRLRWGALLEAAESLGHPSELPPEPAPDYEGDETFLRRVHHVLLEVEVLEGFLQCPDSGRQFPISRGIPNMLLSEEEA